MRLVERLRSYATAGVVVILAIGGTARAQCVGDCNEDWAVKVNELIIGVNISLERALLSDCPSFDASGNQQVEINELISAVNNALREDGCPAECVGDGDCDDGNACTMNSCLDGSCVSSDVVCEDDGNECTAEACDPVSGCGRSNVDDGTSCDGGAGTCQGGVCAPLGEVEYQQDFESLDLASPANTALTNDGWNVYTNIFRDAAKAQWERGYGGPAPNDGGGFCAVVTEQGGPEQGDRQLSVYNDYYNAPDHEGGKWLEANVYQERRITAEDVGNTITFRFDAKLGNINDPADPLCPCASTALAFIKTLNPAAGYVTTNFVWEDTTELPETWGRYMLMLDIDAGLVNQLLQVGFASTATLYQPSGVFYDNLEVSSSPTVP